MNFSIPEDIQAMIRTVRDFTEREVFPLEPQFLNGPFDELLPALKDLRQKVRAMGLWAPYVEVKHGGQGLSLTEYAYISEELGRSPLGHYVFNCQAPDVGNIEILIQHGTEEQQKRYLEPLMEGEIRSCFSMTEPGYPGSNPTWMGTTAEKDGDDYVINGQKWFSSSADGSAFAIVMAVTNPEAESKYRRASMIIVPTDTPGFKLVRNISVMGHTGGDYFSHGEIVYDNCRVPQSNLLGQEGMGFIIAQDRLGPGRIHHCMRWIGICERAFDLMCNWSASRLIAPNQTLGESGVVQNWIGESRAEINAARLMVLQTAWMIEQKGAAAARDEISLIKFYVAGVLQNVLDRAIQVHGGMGVTDDLPLSYWYRHERAARIYDGADEVHKRSVARRLLRNYGRKS